MSSEELQMHSINFAEHKGYELIDFGIYAKPEWSNRDSFYGIQIGLDLLSGCMGLILVWFDRDDYNKCSKEIQAKSLSEFKTVFGGLDVAIARLDLAANQEAAA
ncbi:hypothetical protein Lepto7375DRAFT_0558 [Leptolyngbya sp. PCC 7375]|nr:hypothetical protein Lepto7375DRAFT_0558 [Leptolyngbya sp. PCC 7375]